MAQNDIGSNRQERKEFCGFSTMSMVFARGAVTESRMDWVRVLSAITAA
jgi:hypothetical protein